MFLPRPVFLGIRLPVTYPLPLQNCIEIMFINLNNLPSVINNAGSGRWKVLV